MYVLYVYIFQNKAGNSHYYELFMAIIVIVFLANMLNAHTSTVHKVVL